jgi:glycosyltransferase involved in cell wall biosynthesis
MHDRAGVAVVIPTYNHARFLGAAIESVLSQSVQASEILVVDDGSSDCPGGVVAQYPRVRMVSQPNRGLSAARNRGLRGTRAPYLLFLDADDRLLPDAIRYGLECLESHPEAAFVYGAYRLVNLSLGTSTDMPVQPVVGDPFAAFLRRNLVAMHATALYRRGPLLEARGFREELAAAEDYDLYLRLAQDHAIASHAGLCAEYVIHGENMSGRPHFMLKGVLRVLRDHRPEAARRGLLADYRKGVLRWKRNYVVTWAAAAKRRPLSSVKAGIALGLLAPRIIAGKLLQPRMRVDD